MPLRSVLTTNCMNPRFKDWLLVTLPEEESNKVFIIPREAFLGLLKDASHRFNEIAPLGPYPEIIGVRWKSNNTVYQWFVKKLRKTYEENYKSTVDLEMERWAWEIEREERERTSGGPHYRPPSPF